MVDLNRLRINDNARAGFSIGKGVVLLLLIFLASSFLAGHYIKFSFPWETVSHSVKVMVARKSKPVSVSAFTAGGWIESATPKYPYYVMSQIQGEIVSKINVKEGDFVQPGQIIAEVYNQNKKLEMDLAHANWHIAQAEYERLSNGYRKEEIEGAQASLLDVKEQLVLAEQNFERSHKLGRDVVTQTQIDAHRSAVAALKARVNKEQANLDLLTAGYRKEEIQQARAALTAARVKYDHAKLTYDLCFIRTPEHLPPLRVLKVFAKEGQMLMSEERMGMILALYDPNDMQARVDIRQQNIKQVCIGGPVQLRTDADVSKLYHGEVLRIDPEADIAKNTVSVKIKITDPDTYLFPDMVSQISFLVPEYMNEEKEEYVCEDPDCEDPNCPDPNCVFEDEESSDDDEEEEKEEIDTSVMMVPQGAVQQDDEGRSYVWVNEENKAVKRFISISKVIDGRVTVSGGLASGSRVIISETSMLREGDNVTEE